MLAPCAVRELRALPGHGRAEVGDAIERHSRHRAQQISKSRSKRLRGLSRPQCRPRVGDIRVFCDIAGRTVEILAIVRERQVGIRLRERRSRRDGGAPAEVRDDLSRYLRLAEGEEIVVARHGRAGGQESAPSPIRRRAGRAASGLHAQLGGQAPVRVRSTRRVENTTQAQGGCHVG